MELYQKKEMCCGCGACADICPEKAIKLIQSWDGFYYPWINKSVCIDCGKCSRVCPIKNRKSVTENNFYAGVQAKEEQIRYTSSSGGIFSILAQYVISRGGSVYGAGFNENMEVVHKKAVTQKQLEQIKRTKYVQSNMHGIYKKIEVNLKENRWVLFCGTPCQAQALMLFLSRTYEKLIVVDLVCYGVPSPKVWKDYVRYLECKHKGKMSGFSFRDKRNADNGHMRTYVIDDVEYTDSLYQDIYCKMYFRNYILRPSCHSCKFCTVNRNSDFTIGDFWGIEHVRPDLDDGMGTSMVIIHSDLAKKIWDEIKEDLIWFKCNKDDVLQPRLLKPTKPAKRRLRFLFLYKVLPFCLIVKLVDR